MGKLSYLILINLPTTSLPALRRKKLDEEWRIREVRDEEDSYSICWL